jgi:hypothetical protein
VTVSYIYGSAGTDQVNEAGSLTATGPLTVQNSGQFYYNNTTTGLSVGTLNLTSSGFLGGTGAVTVTTALLWQGATMNGTGSTTVASGATLTISGNSSEVLDTRTFNNGGAGTWSGSNNFYGYNGAVFNNQATGSLTLSADLSLFWGGGVQPTFNNAGTFTKSAGTSTSNIQFYWAGAGPLNVNAATVTFQYGADISGPIAVAATATLNFGNNASYVLEAGSNLTGAGNVGITVDTLDDYGSSSLTGGVTLTGSTTVLFDASQSFGTFTQSGGEVELTPTTTLTLAGDYTESGGFSLLNGGTITLGAGHKVNVTGGQFWGDGTVNGAFQNASALFVGGAQLVGTLTINGSFTQTATGTTTFDVAGGTIPLYDQLVVSGTATLAGNLTVDGLYGYVPPVGTVLTLITYASHVGTFATTSINITGHGGTVHYNATSLTVVTT